MTSYDVCVLDHNDGFHKHVLCPGRRRGWLRTLRLEMRLEGRSFCITYGHAPCHIPRGVVYQFTSFCHIRM